MTDKNKSALTEKDGVSQPETTSKSSAEKIKRNRKKKVSTEELIANILKGDMSFVGPRPALFNQYDLISLRTDKGIDKLIPGITGLAQVNGRDNLLIQEKVNRLDQTILLEEAPKLGQNIRPIGNIMKVGDHVFSKGDVLNPSSIGLLQSMGIRSVLIHNKPSVAIVVTGNELLKPGESFQEGKVFESNSVVLESALNQQGIKNCSIYYTQDTLEDTQNSLEEALESDLVLISGGISVGDYDFVRESLENLGVQEEFYKVNQKPGKPLFFGKKDSKMVFALPGNPASTLNCFYVYVVPILHKLLGKKSDGLACIHTTIDSSISNKFGRALFLKALVHESQAHIIDEHNSATLLSFSKANALVFVPSYTTLMEKGTRAKTWLIPN